ncbi:MAG: hypothetical protein M3441_15905 [Chloroflexota bacterium]|nr:hypothetical protein [Chloroflexota bacterium]
MVSLEFVQQVTLVSTLLLGFSFAALAQFLAARDDKRGILSVTISLFIISAACMLVTTWIGMWVQPVIAYWQSRPIEEVPQRVLDSTRNLVNMSAFPFFSGLLLFLIAFSLMGWLRSRAVGIVSTFTVLVAIVTMLLVWSLIGNGS